MKNEPIYVHLIEHANECSLIYIIAKLLISDTNNDVYILMLFRYVKVQILLTRIVEYEYGMCFKLIITPRK